MGEKKTLAVNTPAPVIVTKQLIRSYAAAVDNMNPLYFNEDAARAAGYGSLVAPASFHAQYGYIRMAIGSGNWVPKGSLHTKQHFEFKKVVQAGDYLHITVATESYEDAKGRTNIEYNFTIKNQRDEVVCVGSMNNLLPAGK